KVTREDFNSETLNMFSRLDDNDVISAMKEWMYSDDFVLSNLCEMIINRNLLKVKIKKKKPSSDKLEKRSLALQKKYNITEKEASYFVFEGEIANLAYKREKDNINILHKNGKINDVVKVSDQFNLKALTNTVTKYYMCYPKVKD
ncbi:MAG: phosphohydrolase, partial [Christiangramia sp.]